MKPAYLLMMSAFCVGCADIRETAADITTISLGNQYIQPVEIDQSVKLSDQPIIACIPIQVDLPERNAVVTLQPSAAGCALTLRQPALTLFDKKQIDNARKQAGSFDIDGIRGGSVELMQVELLNGDNQTLPLAEYVDAVTVEVDGSVLLDKMQPDALLNEQPKRKLPDPLLDKLKTSVKNGQPATADVVLTLWLSSWVIEDVPTAL
ncbi:MAG TPA: hypothetical protein VMF89_00625, partial [Polyangiales bacterium]|nr:hypothetical protein [Polyangiales bacterium]